MRRKTASGQYIGTVVPSQRKLTENNAKLSRKIDGCKKVSARSKKKAGMTLPGIAIDEMNLIIKTTGPELELFIRKIISPHRVKTRTKTKTKKRP